MLKTIDVDFEAFGKDHGLAWIALFGSRARGSERPGSDWDIAVMPCDAAGDSGLLDVAAGLARLLRRSNVDVAWMPSASWLLAWQVARDGRLLQEAQPGAFARFRRAAWRRKTDSRHWSERSGTFVERYLAGRLAMDVELLRENLAQMVQCCGELESLVESSEETFVADFRVHRAAERVLELLVECASTINTEVGEDSKIAPSDYYSSFSTLHACGWIDAATAETLARSASLRNVLVHQYAKVKLPELYRSLRESTPVWRTYVQAVHERLQG